MDSNGRQRNASSSGLSLPSSSTFRRLPTFGKSPFRRGEKASSPPPVITPSSSQDLSAHQRVSTFPSLSKVLGDDGSGSSSFYASNAVIIAGSQFSEAEDIDPNTSSHLLPPSRTSSLPQTPSPQPTSDPFSVHDAPPLPSFPTDLEPITYPSHLAQKKPPETKAPESSTNHATPGPRPGPRQRDFTLGSGATILLGAVHASNGLGEPGSDGLPTGIPKRNEAIIPITAQENADQPNAGWPNSGPPAPISIDDGASGPHGVAGTSPAGGSKGKEGETDSGGEVVTRHRRGTTQSMAKVPLATADDKDRPSSERDRNRSRKASAKLPRLPVKTGDPVLPATKGSLRAPASAMYFSPLPFHGHPPDQALRAHTGTLVGDRIWFIGGVDSKTCWRDVAWFDTESLLWSTVKTFGEQLPPLRAHTTTLVGDRLYVFGGGDGPAYSSDVWVFDTTTHRFSRAPITTARTSIPPPRRAHTTILYRNFLVVFGGGNGQAALNDVWALDVSDPHRLTWHEWRTKGDFPQKKGYHTANLIGDKMIVFGGSDGHASFADVHVLDLQSLVWTIVATEAKHNRLSHTSTQVGSYLFMLGGHNGQTYAQDILLLNLVTLQWESKAPKGVAPPGRGYHVALLHDARIFISGGYNGVSVFNDFWVLDLSAGAYLPQVTTFEIGAIIGRSTTMSHATYTVLEYE